MDTKYTPEMFMDFFSDIDKHLASTAELSKYTKDFLDSYKLNGKTLQSNFLSEALDQLVMRKQGGVNKGVATKFIVALSKIGGFKSRISDDILHYWVDPKEWAAFRDSDWIKTNKKLTQSSADPVEQNSEIKTVRAILLNDNKEVLLGLNASNKEYGLPGGHLHGNELPRTGIVREIFEETSYEIDPKTLVFIFDIEDERVFLADSIHNSRLSPSPIMDPDKEFILFQWFPLDNLPSNLYDCCEEALHRYKRGTIKDDQPQMVWASTSWKDYVQGEYWIVDGHEIPADSELDVGHEFVATEAMLLSHSDEFISRLEEMGIKYEGQDIDEENLITAYTFGAIPPELGKEIMGEKWDHMNKDVREAFMKHHNAIMNINLNFAVWKLTPKVIDQIQSFVMERAEGDMPLSDEEILIEEVSTKRHRSIELSEFLGMKQPGQLWRVPASIQKATANVEEVSEFPGLVVSKVGNKIFAQIRNQVDFEDFKGVINLSTKTGHIQSLKSKTQQLAKEILEWFEKKARNLGVLRIISETLPNSLDFWKSIGYKVIKRENHPPIVKKPLAKEDAEASPSVYMDVQDPGVIEVYVDNKLAYTMDDGAIWETLPRLAQEKSKGRKITFKQKLPSGEIIDFNEPSPPVPTMAAITPEERKIYTDFGKNLKSVLKKEFGIDLRVTVMKSAMSNPWIEVRVAKFEEDVIPNNFRKKIVEKLGMTGIRDMDNIQYGNLRPNSVALKYSEWLKVME